MKVTKVTNTVFPLASSANRIALLVGITAGVVERAEIEAAVIHDTEARPHKKPVVYQNKRYPSVSAAARSYVEQTARRYTRDTYFNKVQAAQKMIARMANDDCWEGCYWSN